MSDRAEKLGLTFHARCEGIFEPASQRGRILHQRWRMRVMVLEAFAQEGHEPGSDLLAETSGLACLNSRQEQLC
jgi:hypothetical protein